MNTSTTAPVAACPTPAPGPTTAEGKAIAARNATTHGLFARDVVLPALGEDPAAFDALLQQLMTQLPPRHLLERHYLEQIAAASWRLRRLHRWQAQIYEDDALTEDQRLDKLDKVLRHETALTRQIDRAIRMMNRDLTDLFQNRAREEGLYQQNATEADCRGYEDLAIAVQQHVWRQMRNFSPNVDIDYSRLDAAPPVSTAPPPADESQNCQNEPQPPAEPQPISEYDYDVDFIHSDGRPAYLDDATWHALRRIHDQGDHARADKFHAQYRKMFLESQQYHRDHPYHEWYKKT